MLWQITRVAPADTALLLVVGGAVSLLLAVGLATWRGYGQHPLIWGGLALAVYVLMAGRMYDQQSLAPHYIHLADALLHGQLHLLYTENLYDLLVVGDRAYVAGSPMPAILLAPVVGFFNNEFSDVLFSLLLSAFNVALVQALFRRPWLTTLFAFGTSALYLASLGSVWLMAHVTATAFGLLALRAGWQQRRWGWAGLWLASGGLARPTLLFGAVFFLGLIWLDRPPDAPRRRGARWRAVAWFGLPVALGVMGHLIYNQARFGRPLDFGYQYTAGAENVVAAYAEYGGFNPHFLGCNLFVSLLNPPEINGYVPPLLYRLCDHLLVDVDLTSRAAWITPNPLGMSILLVTPALVLLPWANWRRRPVWLAGLGLLAVMLPLWLYHNTGSVQFGYRYWMDAAPFWLLLLNDAGERLGHTPARRWLRGGLVALSIAIHLWGWWWMYTLFVGRTWWQLWQQGL